VLDQFTRNQNADPTIVVFVYYGPLATQATAALGGCQRPLDLTPYRPITLPPYLPAFYLSR
jgi:hypothetical protein